MRNSNDFNFRIRVRGKRQISSSKLGPDGSVILAHSSEMDERQNEWRKDILERFGSFEEYGRKIREILCNDKEEEPDPNCEGPEESPVGRP